MLAMTPFQCEACGAEYAVIEIALPAGSPAHDASVRCAVLCAICEENECQSVETTRREER